MRTLYNNRFSWYIGAKIHILFESTIQNRKNYCKLKKIFQKMKIIENKYVSLYALNLITN